MCQVTGRIKDGDILEGRKESLTWTMSRTAAGNLGTREKFEWLKRRRGRSGGGAAAGGGGRFNSGSGVVSIFLLAVQWPMN